MEEKPTKQKVTRRERFLGERGQFLRAGTIVDATILSAPPSTKNQARERDPEMHQTKKGHAWHFGMKAQVGVDLGAGLVHTVIGTAAYVSDVSQAHRLLHGEEKLGLGDAGYQGMEKRPEMRALFGHLPWIVAIKRGQIKAMAEGRLKELTLAVEKTKARMRALVEHPFHVLKNLFGHRRPATRVWPRTRPNSTTFLHSPTWCWPTTPCTRKPRRKPRPLPPDTPPKQTTTSVDITGHQQKLARHTLYRVPPL